MAVADIQPTVLIDGAVPRLPHERCTTLFDYLFMLDPDSEIDPAVSIAINVGTTFVPTLPSFWNDVEDKILSAINERLPVAYVCILGEPCPGDVVVRPRLDESEDDEPCDCGSVRSENAFFVTHAQGGHHDCTGGRADKFGRTWYLPASEVCATCGQPDNCGDCSHEPLTAGQVLELGGVLPDTYEVYAWTGWHEDEQAPNRLWLAITCNDTEYARIVLDKDAWPYLKEPARLVRARQECEERAKRIVEALNPDTTPEVGVCEGHPAGEFDPMGETSYCDGSCAH